MNFKKLGILICTIMILGTGCSNKKIDKIVKQNEELQKKVEQLEKQQTQSSNTTQKSNTSGSVQASSSSPVKVLSEEDKIKQAQMMVTALIDPNFQLLPADKNNVEVINGVKYYVFYEEEKQYHQESDWRYCVAADSNKIYRQLATGEIIPFKGGNTTANQSSNVQQPAAKSNETGISISGYSQQTFNKGTSFYMLRAEFRINNSTNKTIYLGTKDFILRQGGGNAVEPRQDGGGYSYSNSGYKSYKMEGVSLKPGDTCDASFDFNLNNNLGDTFTLYYSNDGELVPVTNMK